MALFNDAPFAQIQGQMAMGIEPASIANDGKDRQMIPRKTTVFEPCPRHAATYASVSRYRRAETMVEGGWANSPCSGDGCRMRPGTDFYTADFVAANPVYKPSS